MLKCLKVLQVHMGFVDSQKEDNASSSMDAQLGGLWGVPQKRLHITPAPF